MKRDCESFQRLERWVPSPNFNARDVAPIQARVLGETLLRPASSISQLADSTTQRCGGGLVMATARHFAMF
jgi:hypothetical protein